MAGVHNVVDVQALQVICSDMQKRGVTAVILGCTELPLVLQQEHIAMPLFDASTIAASIALQNAQ